MNGEPSSFAGIVSLGGGRGGSENIGPQTEASSGGSGGGGRCTDINGAQPGAAGTSGQGFKGGDGTTHSRFDSFCTSSKLFGFEMSFPKRQFLTASHGANLTAAVCSFDLRMVRSKGPGIQ